jgi:hypothetical protein
MIARKLEREHLGLTFVCLSLQIVGSQSDGVLGAEMENERKSDQARTLNPMDICSLRLISQ